LLSSPIGVALPREIEAVVWRAYDVPNSRPTGLYRSGLDPHRPRSSRPCPRVQSQHSPMRISRSGPKASEAVRRHSKAKGASGDVRHGDVLAGREAEPRRIDLARSGREIDGADVHGLGQGLVDEVDDEHSGLGDVAGRVLAVAVRLVLEAEHDERRLLREDVEEAERSGVDHTCRVDRRDERDRPGHDRRAEELVALVRADLGEADGDRQPYSSSSSTPTCEVIRP
jgi:hypothetical protein